MWTLALVLNYTEEMRLQNVSKAESPFQNCKDLQGELEPLDEFTYSNAYMGCVIKENYYRVNFTGVSVSIVFLMSAVSVCFVIIIMLCLSAHSIIKPTLTTLCNQ